MGGDDAKKSGDDEAREYNPRWKGYLFIVLTSLVSFASIASVPKNSVVKHREWGMSVSFGAITFSIVVLILIVDRARCTKSIKFDKAYEGKLEGGLLVCFVTWWIVGVGFTTRVGGIAYQSLNIYSSSWLALASCIFTLNEWSTAKDILSIHELTRLSATLKFWWILFLSSIVAFASSAEAQARLVGSDKDDTSLGISFGLFSAIVSCIAILEHYKLMCCSWLKHGGCLELSFAIVLIVMWIICVSVLTQDGGIAATITGSNPNTSGLDVFPRGLNCTVFVQITESDGDIRREVLQDCEFIPGSNLYCSIWLSLISSCCIAARWKAAQALQFAHAQDKKMIGVSEIGSEQERDEEDFVDASEDAI